MALGTCALLWWTLELDWDHADPADRSIVATARLYDDILVTADRRILGFYPKAQW